MVDRRGQRLPDNLERLRACLVPGERLELNRAVELLAEHQAVITPERRREACKKYAICDVDDGGIALAEPGLPAPIDPTSRRDAHRDVKRARSGAPGDGDGAPPWSQLPEPDQAANVLVGIHDEDGWTIQTLEGLPATPASNDVLFAHPDLEVQRVSELARGDEIARPDRGSDCKRAPLATAPQRTRSGAPSGSGPPSRWAVRRTRRRGAGHGSGTPKVLQAQLRRDANTLRELGLLTVPFRQIQGVSNDICAREMAEALGGSNLTTSAARALAVAGNSGALQFLNGERQGLTAAIARVGSCVLTQMRCDGRDHRSPAGLVARCPELAGESFGDLADRGLRPSRLLPQHGRARETSKPGPWS